MSDGVTGGSAPVGPLEREQRKDVAHCVWRAAAAILMPTTARSQYSVVRVCVMMCLGSALSTGGAIHVDNFAQRQHRIRGARPATRAQRQTLRPSDRRWYFRTAYGDGRVRSEE